MKKRKLITGILTAVVITALLAGCGSGNTAENTDDAGGVAEEEAVYETGEAEEDGAQQDNDSEVTEYPGTPFAQIDVENYGTIKVQLEPSQAPVTVKNFIDLAESGFYDGLTFHRIIDGFMIQGGDPEGNGTGGADHEIKGEFALNGIENNISHVRGVISMARSQDPDSASSQFFIVQADSEFLDGQYAGFGFVTEGIEIVDQICKDAGPVDDNGTILPQDQPVIKGIKIYYE